MTWDIHEIHHISSQKRLSKIKRKGHLRHLFWWLFECYFVVVVVVVIIYHRLWSIILIFFMFHQRTRRDFYLRLRCCYTIAVIVSLCDIPNPQNNFKRIIFCSHSWKSKNESMIIMSLWRIWADRSLDFE